MSDTTSRLKTTAYELVKQFMVYDLNGRLTDLYTAKTDIGNGGPCVHTQYTYDTGGRVLKRKESNADWDSTWDI